MQSHLVLVYYYNCSQQAINTFLVKEFSIKTSCKKEIFGFALVGIIFLFVFTPMAKQAIAIGENSLPNFDDNWYGAMAKIDNQTNQNAIITSWWDFGHFFAAVWKQRSYF